MLDTCASVEEAMIQAESIRISNPLSRLHYMICDRTGKCAVFEFLNSSLSIYSTERFPIQVMANTPYLEAIKASKDPDLKWRRELSDYERNSMERFTRAAELVENSEIDVDFVFDILQSTQREDTVFSLIYDIDHLHICYSTKRFPGRNTICLQEVDFSNAQIAFNLQQASEISPVIYNTDLNRTIAESFFRDPVLTAAFKWEISEEMISFMAEFPDSFKSN
jgi:hypothetical protein